MTLSHPCQVPARARDHPAYVMAATGVSVSYAQLEAGSNRIAHWLRGAVIGMPTPEMGERVVVVVDPRDGVQPNAALSQQLIDFARVGLGPIKAPKAVDFMDALPRQPTGKLYKRLVRDRYWATEPMAAGPMEGID